MQARHGWAFQQRNPVTQGRERLIYTHCHRHERGVWRRRRKMRLIILPAERQKYPLAFYRGACQDVIPWCAKRRCWEDEEREEIWHILQKLEYRFSIRGLSLHLWRLVSNGYEWHMPPCWRSDGEIKTVILLHLLSKQEMELQISFMVLHVVQNCVFCSFCSFLFVRDEQLWPNHCPSLNAGNDMTYQYFSFKAVLTVLLLA